MSNHNSHSRAFNSLFSAAARARQELSNTNRDDLLSATRRLFHRRVQQSQGSVGRLSNPVWQAKIFLLPGPDIQVLPSPPKAVRLSDHGLEGECSFITLEMILEFASGSSTVPPLGFPHRIQIELLHDTNKIFPETNVCLVVLHLPVPTDNESFTKYMKEGILLSPTFGVA